MRPASLPPAIEKARPKRATSFEPLVAKAFGEVARAMREDKKLAQDQFALKASIDRSYYGKLERGERQPSLALLLRVAAALGVTGATLIEQTEVALKRLDPRGPPG